MQTKTVSAMETVINVGSGLCISWVVTMTILPLMLGVVIQPVAAIEVTALYTAISLLRSYIWRRVFNRYD